MVCLSNDLFQMPMRGYGDKTRKAKKKKKFDCSVHPMTT